MEFGALRFASGMEYAEMNDKNALYLIWNSSRGLRQKGVPKMADRMGNQRAAENQNPQNRQENRSLARQSNQRGISPYGGTMSMHEMMRRFADDMDSMFAALGWPFSSGTNLMNNMGTVSWVPAVDVFRRGNDLVVQADLPGINPQDVKVEAEKDAIVISGHEQTQNQNEDQGYWYSERSYGSFYRRIPLPQGTNVDSAHAEFNNGVLEITVPGAARQTQTQPKQIPVKSGQQATQGQVQQPAVSSQTSQQTPPSR